MRRRLLERTVSPDSPSIYPTSYPRSLREASKSRAGRVSFRPNIPAGGRVSKSPRRDRRELHPARLHALAGRHRPGGVFVRPLGREDVRRLPDALVVFPREGHLRRVRALRPINEVRLAARVIPLTVVAESHTHRRHRVAAQRQRPPAEALRPEVLRLVAAAGDGPAPSPRAP